VGHPKSFLSTNPRSLTCLHDNGVRPRGLGYARLFSPVYLLNQGHLLHQASCRPQPVRLGMHGAFVSPAPLVSPRLSAPPDEAEDDPDFVTELETVRMKKGKTRILAQVLMGTRSP
jgi:hypothetical protein